MMFSIYYVPMEMSSMSWLSLAASLAVVALLVEPQAVTKTAKRLASGLGFALMLAWVGDYLTQGYYHIPDVDCWLSWFCW